MRRDSLRPASALRAASFWTLLAMLACATNPVTRQSQLMLVSEQEEVQIGKESAKEIEKQYGYDTSVPGLAAYVDGVGQKLVAQCERRDIAYHFQVLDTPMINAFALPGGFVYVTRGILGRMNSEDELAAVLGHELTHVAARHGAQQLSKAYAAQFGLAAISILSPNVAEAAGGLVNVSLSLAFLGYSRGLEHQADEHGITYMERAGYNPRGAIKMFRMFDALEAKDPSRMERFLMSHPPTAERLAYAQQRFGQYAETDETGSEAALRREPFLKHIDGLKLGKSRGGKIVLGDTFYDKPHGAALTVPDTYEADLGPAEGEAVFVRLTKQGDSARRFEAGFEVDPAGGAASAEAYAKAYLKKIKLPVTERKTETLPLKAGGSLLVRVVDLQAKDGVIRAMLGFLVKGKTAYVIYGYTDQASFPGAKAEFRDILASLRFPSRSELDGVQPPRLKLVKAGSGDTWQSICRREYGKEGLGPRLALFNGVFSADRQPTTGMLLKIPDKATLKAGAEG